MEEDSISGLIGQLNLHSEDERAHAAEQLARLGARAVPAIPALLRTVADQSVRVALKASRAIQDIGAAGMPLLFHAVRNPDSVEFRPWTNFFNDVDEYRQYAADALADLGRDALPYLVKGLHDANVVVRRASLEALPRLGVAAEEISHEIAGCLRHLELTDSAAMSLARIARSRARVETSPALKMIAAALEDSQPVVRISAISAMEVFRENGDLVRSLLAKVIQDENEQVRNAALELVRRLP